MCTKLSKEATELLLQTPEEAEIERIEVMAGLLEEKLKIMNELDEAMLNVYNEIQIEIEESAQTTDGILTTKRKIERYTKLFKQMGIKDFGPAQDQANNDLNVTNSNGDSSEKTGVNNEENIENVSSHVLNNLPAFQVATTANNVTPPAGHFVSSLPKLPKLELPKFEGKLNRLEFLGFIRVHNT